jgi:outer membrane receptor protein involved in Fe transport
LSLFYKDFKNHIELIKTPQGFTWQNAEKSEVKGLELEGRKKLFRDFEFRANVTLASSNTGFVQNFLFVKDGIKSYTPIDTISRQMFGQAPYVLNGLLTYTNDSIGFSVGIGYNVQGPRLVLVSTDLTPNVFEMPRHLVDIKISKDLGKYFVVSFNIKDLLNSPVRRAYKYPEGYTLDFDRFQFGTNYILSFAYKL